METYIGLHVTDQQVLAVLCDSNGKTIATTNQLIKLIEIDDLNPVEYLNQLISTVKNVLLSLIQNYHQQPHAIGLAVRSQLLICWDSKTGSPLSCSSVTTVPVNGSRLDTIKGHSNTTSSTSGDSQSISHVNLPVLQSNHIQKLIASKNPSNIMIGPLSSFIVANLTPTKTLGDITSLTELGLLNEATNSYDEIVLQNLHIEHWMLVTPTTTDSLFGNVSNPDLSKLHNVPIHAVIREHPATAYLLDPLSHGRLIVTLTNDAEITMNTVQRIETSSMPITSTRAFNVGGESRFMIKKNMPSFSMVLNWMVDNLEIAPSVIDLEIAARRVKNTNHISFIASCENKHGSPNTADQRFLIAGLDPSSSIAQLARSAFESVAIQFSLAITTFKEIDEPKVEQIDLSGELSNLNLLSQLIADYTRIPTRANYVSELAAIGAAMHAAVARGSKSLTSVEEIMLSSNEYLPTPNFRTISSKTERWLDFRGK